ncbi:MAG: 50S ribosomal protein L7 [Firmicutes bacterium HGW-Firmicutes-21]|nr:MAG: 50S ribosomal protein L7 [Firmicutes bacterium HGW-Firmicutes-21]
MKKLLGIIGLAYRAGAVAVGTNNVLVAIKGGKAKLVLMANDISDNTDKVLSDKAGFRSIKTMRLPVSMNELGHALGKKSTSSVAFTDENFIIAVLKQLSENPPGIKQNSPVGANPEHKNFTEA